MDRFRHLLAEQSTPLELIYFIIAVCALAIVLAAIVYAAVMSVLWALRLRHAIRFHRVFLPTRAHLKAFLPEYLLAFATSAVVTLTIAEKHDIVDAVLDYDVTALEQAEVEGLFPLRNLPTEGLRSADAKAASVLRPVLEAGRAGEVRRLVAVIVPQVAATPRATRILRRTLLVASILLIAVYLGWLAWGRVKSLQASSDAEVSYRPTLRRIATMGVVLALLLASPVLVEDAALLADSALGALRHETAGDDDEVATAVRDEVRRQHDLQAGLFTDTTSPSIQALVTDLGVRMTAAERGLAEGVDSIDALRLASAGQARALAAATGDFEALRRGLDGQLGRLDALERERAGLVAELDALARRNAALSDAVRRAAERDRADLGRLADAITANGRDIDGLEGGVDALSRRMESLASALQEAGGGRDRRDGMELVFVESGAPYSLLRGDRVVAQGPATGLHWLPAGAAYEARTRGGIDRFTLALGTPYAVRWQNVIE